MPRKYIKRNVRCQYSQEAMEQAVKDVKKGVSLAKAAAIHQVPKSTLAKHSKDGEKPRVRCGRKPELSPEDEAIIAEYLLECQLHGEGLKRNEVRQLAKEYIIRQNLSTRWGNEGPGNDWLQLFFKRHPDLCNAVTENPSSQESESILILP